MCNRDWFVKKSGGIGDSDAMQEGGYCVHCMVELYLFL